MQAALLMAGRKSVSKRTALVGWNYDKNVSTGSRAIASSHATTQLIADTVALSGYTKVLKMNGTAVSFTPVSAFKLDSDDFTLEVRIRTLTTGSNYVGGFYINDASTGPTEMIFGDTGFGYRALTMILRATGSQADLHAIPLTQTSFMTWKHYVLQRKGNVWSIYVGGQLQQTATYTSTAWSNTPISKSGSISLPNAAGLGYFGQSYNANANIAEWAIFDDAPYSDNFTPPVGYLVD